VIGIRARRAINPARPSGLGTHRPKIESFAGTTVMKEGKRVRSTSTPLRVVVADPDPVARAAIVHSLERDRRIEVVGDSQEVAETIQLVETAVPDVAVISEWFPGARGGVDAAREIRYKAPQTRVLMLVLPSHDHDLLAGVRAGVRGYIVKRADMRQLPPELRRAAAEGASPISSELSEELLAELQQATSAGPSALTRREQEVMALVQRGLSNREIAEALSIGVSTVKTHVHALLKKFGCTRRVQLVALDRMREPPS
jgi:DNA-binding NarL/FixJ family response regulator